MMSVKEYITLVMNKKHITKAELVRKLNEIEKEHNEKKTHAQNLNDYFNLGLPFRPKMLVKLEVALGLSYGTLVNMVAPPLSREGKKELERIKEMYRK